MYGLIFWIVVPASLVKGTNRYWRAACCFEQDGWSTAISAIFLSLPIRYPLWRCIYNTGKALSPLNGYRRHLLLGMRASSGSLYLITTPRNELVSSASFPVVSKFGFSFSFTGFGEFFCFLSPHSYFESSFLNRRRSRSSCSVLEYLKVVISLLSTYKEKLQETVKDEEHTLRILLLKEKFIRFRINFMS